MPDEEEEKPTEPEEPIRVEEEPDWDKLGKDPEKLMAAVMKQAGQFVRKSEEMMKETVAKEPLPHPPRFICAYTIKLPNGDTLSVHFQTEDLKQIHRKVEEIRECWHGATE